MSLLPSDEDLNKAADGFEGKDPTALDWLIDSSKDYVSRCVRKIRVRYPVLQENEEWTDNLTQPVLAKLYLKIFEKKMEFPRDSKTLGKSLYRMVKHELKKSTERYNRLKRRPKGSKLEGDLNELLPADQSSVSREVERRDFIEAQLGRLEKFERQVIELRYGLGVYEDTYTDRRKSTDGTLSIESISEILDCTFDKARRAFERAIRLMKG